MISGTPWDPSSYPGWWSRFDVLLPEFSPSGHLFGVPGWGLVLELVLLAGAVAGLVWWAGRPEVEWLRAGAATGAAAVVVAVLAAVAPLPLPSGTRTFTGSDLGSPLPPSPAGSQGPVVPLQGVGRGTFRITVDYTMSGPGGSFTSVCSSAAPGGNPPSEPVRSPGTHSEVISVKCSGGTIWFSMYAAPGTALMVNDLVLQKTSVH